MYIGQFLNRVKYDTKILFSNKYILCIVFFVFMPFAVNFGGTEMALGIFELYIPIVGIVLFTDIINIEEKFKTQETLYLKKTNKTNVVIIRTLINIVFVCLFSVITLLIISSNLCSIVTGSSLAKGSAVNYLDVLALLLPTTIFLGLLSMTVANIFLNSIVGYIISFFYWVYWLVNLDVKSVMNPFGYTAHVENYALSKFLLIIFSIVLLIINNYFVNKSPFHNKLGSFLRFGKKNL